MNLPMKPQGFFRTAGIGLALKFTMASTLLAAMFAGPSYSLWTSLYPKLDTVFARACTDTGAETGETAYTPSKAVAQCTQSAHTATLMLVGIVTALLICAAVTAQTLMVDGYAKCAYEGAKQDVPVQLRSTMKTVRHNCGVAAFMLSLCIVIVIVLRG